MNLKFWSTKSFIRWRYSDMYMPLSMNADSVPPLISHLKDVKQFLGSRKGTQVPYTVNAVAHGVKHELIILQEPSSNLVQFQFWAKNACDQICWLNREQLAKVIAALQHEWSHCDGTSGLAMSGPKMTGGAGPRRVVEAVLGETRGGTWIVETRDK